MGVHVVTPADLTPAELSSMTNGCGPGSWKATIPTWHGRDTCCQHDIDYWAGGDEEDRAIADRRLYDGLIAATKAAWFGARIWMWIESWFFYRAVRLEGSQYFHYGVPRTLADLRKEP